MWLGVVILVASTMGITVCNRVGALAHNFFCIVSKLLHNIGKNSSEASTPTCGGDAFDMELTKSHRFGAPGLNLAFEGLLLGASLHTLAEGTSSDPH
jgi:hypothetical protein